jgi:hypothetical protein
VQSGKILNCVTEINIFVNSVCDFNGSTSIFDTGWLGLPDKIYNVVSETRDLFNFVCNLCGNTSIFGTGWLGLPVKHATVFLKSTYSSTLLAIGWKHISLGHWLVRSPSKISV